jgi:hypothetical protein
VVSIVNTFCTKYSSKRINQKIESRKHYFLLGRLVGLHFLNLIDINQFAKIWRLRKVCFVFCLFWFIEFAFVPNFGFSILFAFSLGFEVDLSLPVQFGYLCLLKYFVSSRIFVTVVLFFFFDVYFAHGIVWYGCSVPHNVGECFRGVIVYFCSYFSFFSFRFVQFIFLALSFFRLVLIGCPLVNFSFGFFFVLFVFMVDFDVFVSLWFFCCDVFYLCSFGVNGTIDHFLLVCCSLSFHEREHSETKVTL